jgi:hypothetical protein
MKKFFSAVAVSVALTTPVYAQDFSKGLAAHNSGDYATALQEWRPLAEQGYGSAQYNLGVMYSNGQGVTQDYKEAVKWYLKSAEQGYASAQYNLGVMYSNGEGVTQDYKEAAKWYLKSAEQGHANAQVNLGNSYSKGEGVLQDNVVAHMWSNIANANGNELGGQNRDTLAKEMTPQDISKAQAMARECMGSNYQHCGD